MILVFKTSVSSKEEAEQILPFLNAHVLPHGNCHFDLEDRDRILRVEGHDINASHFIGLLNEKGFECFELED